MICAGALVAVLLLGAGCRRGSGGTSFFIPTPFPVHFFPLALDPGADTADVAFDGNGDVLVVSGGDSVRRVSAEAGLEAAAVATCVGEVLLSVAVSGDTTYVGTDDGRILAIDSDGVCAEEADLGLMGEAVTGLAPSPAGFGAPSGSLIVAAGLDGIRSVDLAGDPPELSDLAATGHAYHDIAFFQSRLFAIEEDRSDLMNIVQRIVEIEFGDPPLVTEFATGVIDGVGLAVDGVNGELLVADASPFPGLLRSIPVASGGALAALANYAFDSTTLPSGLALDGAGTMVFTTSSAVLRAVRVPPILSTLTLRIDGPDTGYGDLEFDKTQDLLLVGNNESADPDENFLYRVGRRGDFLDTLGTDVSVSGEVQQRLFSLAPNYETGDLYLGTEGGQVLKRDSSGTVTALVTLDSEVLGLELTPATESLAVGPLLASLFNGKVCIVDLVNPIPGDCQSPAGSQPIPDLVFDRNRTLYAVQRPGPGQVPPAAIWQRPEGGAFAPLGVSNPSLLGAPEGVALDEGGNRLLVASEFAATTDQILELRLDTLTVRTLAFVDLDGGPFPSGLIYDGLGRVLLRTSNDSARIDAFRIPVIAP